MNAGSYSRMTPEMADWFAPQGKEEA